MMNHFPLITVFQLNKYKCTAAKWKPGQGLNPAAEHLYQGTTT